MPLQQYHGGTITTLTKKFGIKYLGGAITKTDQSQKIKLFGGFQLEFVSISQVINTLQDLLSSLNGVISTNERH